MTTKRMRFLFTSALIFLMLYCLFFPYSTVYYCRKALDMCFLSVIPSLFIFMVLSRILSHLSVSKASSGKFICFLSRCFGLDASLIPICFFGLFCGAPSGAFGIRNIYSSGEVSKDEAERASALANNCSAAFIMSLASATAGGVIQGFYILISNVLSAITVYFLIFKRKKSPLQSRTKNKHTKEQNRKSLSRIISESITSSAEACVNICGYVIFFSVLGAILCDEFTGILSRFGVSGAVTDVAGCLFAGIFEMSSGVTAAGNVEGYEKIILISFAVAFCGLSVIFQVKGILEEAGLSAGKYIASRFLCALVSPIFSLILLYFSPFYINVFSASTERTGGFTFSDLIYLAFATFCVFAGASILSRLDKKHKNCQ